MEAWQAIVGQIWVAMACSLTTPEINSITPNMGLTEEGTFMETMPIVTMEAIILIEDKCIGEIMVQDHMVGIIRTMEAMDTAREAGTEGSRAFI